MNYMLRVDERAQDEIFLAMEELSPSRALRFQLELEQIFDTVIEFPFIYPMLKLARSSSKKHLRRVLIHSFPFGLIYTVLAEQEVIKIIKCYHTRSNPEKWLENIQT